VRGAPGTPTGTRTGELARVPLSTAPVRTAAAERQRPGYPSGCRGLLSHLIGGGEPVRQALVTLFVILVYVAASAKAAERRVALVIGNSAYQHADPLANPVRDARAIAGKLREIGFAEVMVETDRSVEAMRLVLREFGSLAEGADIAVVCEP
jgi:Caspase domain